jgi:hypothetical protein
VRYLNAIHYDDEKVLTEFNGNPQEDGEEEEVVDSEVSCMNAFVSETINVDNLSEKNTTSLNYTENLIKIYNYKIDFKKINLNQVFLNNQKFLLVIDFPNLGGGVSAFLKIILSKYKENINFLIARNYNGLVRFTINDEFYIENEYNEIESIEFLESYKKYILKIFINHTKDHSEIFLNKLYEIKKEITMILHDYYFLNKIYSQPYIEDIKNISKSELNIKNINKILLANSANLDLIKPFLSINNEIVILQLPDFKNSLEKHPIHNDKIVIGIIGIITNIKGSEIIEEFFVKNGIEKESLEKNSPMVYGDTDSCHVSVKRLLEKNNILYLFDFRCA